MMITKDIYLIKPKQDSMLTFSVRMIIDGDKITILSYN